MEWCGKYALNLIWTLTSVQTPITDYNTINRIYRYLQSLLRAVIFQSQSFSRTTHWFGGVDYFKNMKPRMRPFVRKWRCQRFWITIPQDTQRLGFRYVQTCKLKFSRSSD